MQLRSYAIPRRHGLTMWYFFDSPPRLPSLCNSRGTQPSADLGRSTVGIEKLSTRAVIGDAWARERRRLLVGYLAEGEGDREKEDKVDARRTEVEKPNGETVR